MKLRNRWPELTIVAGILLFAIWYCTAFVLPNHPRRPKNVSPSATLIFQGGLAFWERCWVDENINQNSCQIFNGAGVILVDDIFLPYSGTGPVPESRLKISSNGHWGYITLQDGTILIPQKHYDAIRQQISPKVPK